MRISVPTLPIELQRVYPSSHILEDVGTAVRRLAAFIAPGNVTILTGAGVSVDSGIRAYRGTDGRYLNPNYKPILYQEISAETERGFAYRRRYWLRSFLGYPHVRNALPNPTHYALAALQYSGHAPRLITQNVDGLHKRALGEVWTASKMSERITELHGTLHSVECKYGHVVSRDEFQHRLGVANPRWAASIEDWGRTGARLRTNPDGDVVLEDVSYDDFIIPECPSCFKEGRQNTVHKPGLVFFGESISQKVKERSFADIETCERLLILGTTLATYSSFRLLKHAISFSKPVLMVNVGPTRADTVGSGLGEDSGVKKIELPVGDVVRDAVREVLGSRAESDGSLKKLLTSGTVTPLAS